ncbi:unnamed protein product [Owenia fusiformis]|uniref:Uncharacterized protein n=1 Tax=Owenia fusiformis TaxID=6347 RepID=A0A8S4PN47_OWEFU|nr:unnamed protein product [Owenia fusiformis]
MMSQLYGVSFLDEKPYWMDLKPVFENIEADIAEAAASLRNIAKLNRTSETFAKDFNHFFAVNADTVMHQILQELLASLDTIEKAIEPIGSVVLPFVTTFDDTISTIQNLTEAFRGIQEGYDAAKSLLDNVFGPKISKGFPKKYLESEDCGNGFYPSTQGGNYDYQGVQLEAEVGSELVVPFSGILTINSIRRKVTILTTELKDTEIIIENVEVHSAKNGTEVKKNEVLGHVTYSASLCMDSHIHFTMKKIGSNAIIDPTRYLEKRRMNKPAWIQKCDDYNVIWKEIVFATGTVTGGPEEKDTSPTLENNPDTSMPEDLTKDERRKRESSDGNILDITLNALRESLVIKMGIPNITEFGPDARFRTRDLSLKKVKTFLRESKNDQMVTRIDALTQTIMFTLSLQLCSMASPETCLPRVVMFQSAVLTIPTQPDCRVVQESHMESKASLGEMTLGEFEELSAPIDGATISDLMKDIRMIYVHLLDRKINNFMTKAISEDFESFDICLEGGTYFGPLNVAFFEVTSPLVMIGPIPLTFTFKAGGSVGMGFNCEFCILSMKVTGGVRPTMGSYVRGAIEVGLVFIYTKVRITGYLMTTSFPTRVGLGYSKFPLDVSARMDLELIPLRLVLDVGLFMSIPVPFEMMDITIFRINLWEYTTPSIKKNIFQHNDPKPDDTPPDFSFYTVDQDESLVAKRAATTVKCSVKQLAGRDFTEPAFQLAVAVYDDVSQVDTHYCVGTYLGGCNLVPTEPMGGFSTVVSRRLTSGIPLYYLIIAKNSQGGSSSIECELPTYDMTLPTGRVIPDFRSTSYPHALRASAKAIDDSPLDRQALAVGYGQGQWGDQLIPWHVVTVNKTATIVDTGDDPHGSRSLDYFTCYENILSSKSIIADFTPPATGPIEIPLTDETIHEKCEEYVTDIFAHRCIEPTTLNNHRVIVDGVSEPHGPHSMCVFNGDEAMTDMRWTRDNKYCSANWDGFHDNETGIYGYLVSVGTEVCRDDHHPHKDPHAHITFESEWTHEAMLYPLYMPDGHYYINVRALNKVEFGGPMAVTVCHSLPYIVDTTPPIVHYVKLVSYDEYTHLLIMNYDVSDPLSDIREVDFCLGRSRRDCYILDWERFPNITHLEKRQKIPDGTPAWPKIRAINNVDLREVGPSEHPIVVDTSPPIAGNVYDGWVHDTDMEFQNRNDILCANWKNFTDPDSGISAYKIGFGTQEGLDDIVPLKTLGHNTYEFCTDQSNVHLEHNITYFTVLYAVNGGHKLLNVSVTTNGVLVDMTEPNTGLLRDGLDANVDKNFTSAAASVLANWNGFNDPESEVISYSLAVYKQRPSDSDDVYTEDILIHEGESIGGNVSQIEWHHFHHHHGDYIYVEMNTTNGANTSINTKSSGTRVDLTSPEVRYIGDGLVPGENAMFSSSLTELAANWLFSDTESGIEYYLFTIFGTSGGTKRQIFPKGLEPQRLNATVNLFVAKSLNLETGGHYNVRVAAVNRAGLTTVHDTDGVTVDDTPPEMKYVRIGVVDGEMEDLDEAGNVISTDNNGIQASWLAVDIETGVKEYNIAVGTSPGEGDVLDYRNVGDTLDGYIDNLNLTIYKENGPLYYVSVIARNWADQLSEAKVSKPLKIVEEDKPGRILDGVEGFPEVNVQKDKTTVTAHFVEFRSEFGYVGFEWSVGSAHGFDDIQPFTDRGIVIDNNGFIENSLKKNYSGMIQAPAHLIHSNKYHVTVRGKTGKDNIVEGISDGFVVDVTPPKVIIKDMGLDVNMTQSSLYQTATDSLSANWNISDQESKIEWSGYCYGTGPGQCDVYNMTSTGGKMGLEPGQVQPITDGKPNFLNVIAENEVGLTGKSLNPITADDTPAREGSIICPLFLKEHENIVCHWTGFVDDESGIDYFSAGIGVKEGDGSIHKFVTVSHYASIIEFKEYMNNSLPAGVYYMTLSVVNGAGLTRESYAPAIVVDATPPLPGLVIELDGIFKINATESSKVPPLNRCSSTEECLASDVKCQTSQTNIQVSWLPFMDEESPVIRYELAVGSTRGGSQLKPFYEVPLDTYIISVSHLDLSQQKMVFVTVRATNAAGLTTISSSNGVHISRISAGLQPLGRFTVYDGSSPGIDMSFQKDREQLTANWEFNGDPCPMETYTWSIYKFDGTVFMSATKVPQGQTYGVYDGLNLRDGEEFFVVVQGTNSLGFTQTVRSDGITIKQEPLMPGVVRDGPVFGVDFDVQPSVTQLWGNWDAFGKDRETRPDLINGNPDLNPHIGDNQRIHSYEVAVGTDRRYPKTRANIYPFVNAGLNQTWHFTSLNLIPQTAHYFITVKATSWSGAVRSQTSNGIRVGFGGTVVKHGELKLADCIPSDSEISFSWQGFKFGMPVMFYQWGISSNLSAVDNLTCEQLQLYEHRMRENDLHLKAFDIQPMSNVLQDSTIKQTGLKMVHGSSYLVVVIATDESSICSMVSKIVLVDTTAPLSGTIQVGPANELVQGIMFEKWADRLAVEWTGYSDPESYIENYKLTLHEGIVCDGTNQDISTTDAITEQITLNSNLTKYTFYQLYLKGDRPYYVKFEATNCAGLVASDFSRPILIEQYIPLPGTIKDGLRFDSDIEYQTSTKMIQGSFFSQLNPSVKDVCPENILELTMTTWHYIHHLGVWGSDSNIMHHKFQSTSIETGFELSIVPDVKIRRMLAGAVDRGIEVVSGKYEFVIQASDLHEYSVTSVVLRDGPRGVFVDLDVDMSEYINVTNNDKYTTSSTSSPPAHSSTSDLKVGTLPLDGDTYNGSASASSQNSCGFQVHTAVYGNLSYAVLLCSWENGSRTPNNEIVQLQFDPSKSSHTYTLQLQMESNAIELAVDGKIIALVYGVPVIKKPGLISLGVRTKEHYYPDIFDPFNRPKSAAYFKFISVPRSKPSDCNFGAPFKNMGSPLFTFEAGLGTTKTDTDVVAYKPIGVNCLPCTSLCSRLYCDQGCKAATKLYQVTLDGLDLPDYQRVNVSSTNATGIMAATYFVHVKGITGSGISVTSTSNGVTIDTSDPIIDILYHVDVSVSNMNKVYRQGQDKYIAARWDAYDKESQIAEFEWGIGRNPFTTDIQPYRSVGLQRMGISDDLGGILHDNSTYFITLRVTNGAGGKTINASLGVLVYLPKNISGLTIVNATCRRPYQNQIIIRDVTVCQDQDGTGINWLNEITQEANDQVIYYVVGSNPWTADDIIPKLQIAAKEIDRAGKFESGKVKVEEGHIIMEPYGIVNISDARQVYDTKRPISNTFHMEPGRLLYSSLEKCQPGDICNIVASSTALILRSTDIIKPANEGCKLLIANSETTIHVHVYARGGLNNGKTLACGTLADTDVKETYVSDASVKFKPYIVDPESTTDQTDRQLRHRLGSWSGVSFFVNSIGEALDGSLTIALSTSDINFSSSNLTLLFWHSDLSKWMKAEKYCEHGQASDRTLGKQGDIKISVCSLPPVKNSPGPMKQLQRISQYNGQIQFALTEVSNVFINTAPHITSTNKLKIKENSAKLEFQLVAVDEEADPFVFLIVNDETFDSRRAALTPEGLLTYQPCPYCNGNYVIELEVVENRTDGEIALSSTQSLIIEVTPVNDNPVAFLGHKGDYKAPYRTYGIDVTVEQMTEWTEPRFDPLRLLIGAYDYDLNDDLTFSIVNNTNGTIQKSDSIKKVFFEFQNCSLPYSQRSQKWLQVFHDVEKHIQFPCDFPRLALPVDKMQWLFQPLTYTPKRNEYGTELIQVMVYDQERAFSDVVNIHIHVLENKCQHGGTCNGDEVNDTDCKSIVRSNGFQGYKCTCLQGYNGDYCENEINECLSSPCRPGYTCIDNVGSFICYCDPKSSCSDYPWWVWLIVAISVLLAFIAIPIVLCLVKKRIKKKTTPVEEWQMKVIGRHIQRISKQQRRRSESDLNMVQTVNPLYCDTQSTIDEARRVVGYLTSIKTQAVERSNVRYNNGFYAEDWPIDMMNKQLARPKQSTQRSPTYPKEDY